MLEATAEEYANAIMQAIKSHDIDDDDDRDQFLDTYAFVTMAIEARKALRDDQKIKEARTILKGYSLVRSSGTRRASSHGVDVLTNLKTYRTHLQSARELAGE